MLSLQEFTSAILFHILASHLAMVGHHRVSHLWANRGKIITINTDRPYNCHFISLAGASKLCHTGLLETIGLATIDDCDRDRVFIPHDQTIAHGGSDRAQVIPEPRWHEA